MARLQTTENEHLVRALLEEPSLLGVVGTTRTDGSPQLTPVWFRFDGSSIWIWTEVSRKWVANIHRDGRVSFSVHENNSPWRSVVIRGRATLATLQPPETMNEIRRISERYLDLKDIDAYIADWPTTRSLVTVQPKRLSVSQAFR